MTTNKTLTLGTTVYVRNSGRNHYEVLRTSDWTTHTVPRCQIDNLVRKGIYVRREISNNGVYVPKLDASFSILFFRTQKFNAKVEVCERENA